MIWMKVIISTLFPELDDGPKVRWTEGEISMILSSPMVEASSCKMAIKGTSEIEMDEKED